MVRGVIDTAVMAVQAPAYLKIPERPHQSNAELAWDQHFAQGVPIL